MKTTTAGGQAAVEHEEPDEKQLNTLFAGVVVDGDEGGLYRNR